jgi:capsular polysaccharide biosynthesis protein
VNGDTFHNTWGKPGIVDIEIPRGKRQGDRCSFPQPGINYLWESLNTSTNFYHNVEYLSEEKDYQYDPVILANNITQSKMFMLPKTFAGIRHPKEVLETFRHYHELDEVCSRQNNQDQAHIDLRTSFYDDLMNINETLKPRRMAIFKDVFVNNYGLIVNRDDCRYLRNAGCWFMKHPRIYNLNGSPHVHDHVISLGAGASGTWHFPMECFVALAGVSKEILQKSVFHVPTRSPFITGWLHLLNIPDSNIIDSPLIVAKTLYVPEMGRCGETFPTQIQWLRKIVNLPIDHVKETQENMQQIIEDSKIDGKFTTLLIHRSGSRQIRNPQEVENRVKSYAANHGMNFVLHHDQHLPSLPDQIKRFSKAHIIVAPHGAALLFAAFAPPNACIIEFMPILNPECYARIAYIRKLDYIMYTMDNGAAIKVSELEEGLEICKNRVMATTKP